MEASHCGQGRSIGAVVVNPKTQQIVAVAGDARWWSDNRTRPCNPMLTGEGRPEHHALMRVVAMVANRELRRRLAAGSHVRFASTCTESPAGQALTGIEKVYADAVISPVSPVSTPTSPSDVGEKLAASLTASLAGLGSTTSPRVVGTTSPNIGGTASPRSDGYLCSGLDIYLTHEPCVCCAMAMIHSRFRSCVFEKRMPGSGSLTARDYGDSLSYGLFWRRELNWRVMTFKYGQEKDRHQATMTEETFHA